MVSGNQNQESPWIYGVDVVDFQQSLKPSLFFNALALESALHRSPFLLTPIRPHRLSAPMVQFFQMDRVGEQSLDARPMIGNGRMFRARWG
jgi:hypothetical protein